MGMNEQETRYHLIDPILFSTIGLAKMYIQVWMEFQNE